VITANSFSEGVGRRWSSGS